MADSWAIEAHDTSGRRFFSLPAVTTEVEGFVARLLAHERTGGIVIYRSTVAPSDAQLQQIWEEAGGDCETEEEENPENFEKVASGNLLEDVELGNGVTMKAGPVKMVYTPHPSDVGSCQECGCPPEDMPMINRRTGWCCGNCHKEQLARSNNVE